MVRVLALLLVVFGASAELSVVESAADRLVFGIKTPRASQVRAGWF
jgi:hypothetical protein